MQQTTACSHSDQAGVSDLITTPFDYEDLTVGGKISWEKVLMSYTTPSVIPGEDRISNFDFDISGRYSLLLDI